ncbi:hypothetical protein MIND_00927400 [Mycena indigotica]|uniref:Uncharacterized protein n=1 Tax=Mycena indigotica TaxID=2126181 RepID=A0A8H6VWT7_9AGAR|nr:uncharacterized protein MIND_00927400 [Mycena indigotica]KAF7296954.1 hypothetical protein MIND_00927400 [Mycena indigotica]
MHHAAQPGASHVDTHRPALFIFAFPSAFAGRSSVNFPPSPDLDTFLVDALPFVLSPPSFPATHNSNNHLAMSALALPLILSFLSLASAAPTPDKVTVMLPFADAAPVSAKVLGVDGAGHTTYEVVAPVTMGGGTVAGFTATATLVAGPSYVALSEAAMYPAASAMVLNGIACSMDGASAACAMQTLVGSQFSTATMALPTASLQAEVLDVLPGGAVNNAAADPSASGSSAGAGASGAAGSSAANSAGSSSTGSSAAPAGTTPAGSNTSGAPPAQSSKSAAGRGVALGPAGMGVSLVVGVASLVGALLVV